MPKVVDKPKMQSAILASANRVFLEKGYHAAKMTDIAQAAGLAKGTLYLYFENKDALTVALMTKYFHGLEEGFMAQPPPRSLDEMIGGLSSGLAIDDSYARTVKMFIETFGPGFSDDTVRQMAADVFDRIGERLARDIADLQAVGALREDLDPAAAGRALTAMLDGMLLHRGLFRLESARYEQMIGAVAAMLRAALKP